LFFLVTSYSLFRRVVSDELEMAITRDQRAHVTMSFVLACVVEAALSAFLSFHTYLILTNQTTMEWATGRKRRPYDLGRSRNWSQIFGDHGVWKWAFPFLHVPAETSISPLPAVGTTLSSHRE
jgi:hypothetical protein